jgi:hypothetical protein
MLSVEKVPNRASSLHESRPPHPTAVNSFLDPRQANRPVWPQGKYYEQILGEMQRDVQEQRAVHQHRSMRHPSTLEILGVSTGRQSGLTSIQRCRNHFFPE